MEKSKECLIIVRGGGDIATGAIQKLFHAGFKLVVLETEAPLMIRSTVALGYAVFGKETQVEDVTSVCVEPEEIEEVWQQGKVPIVIDPQGKLIEQLKPDVVVDGILAKKNLGTNRQMAPITIALGPGFSAPEDVDVVVETMRGHALGKLILNGSSLPNTGIPGVIGGKGAERVIWAPVSGKVSHICQIGDQVASGQTLFKIGETKVLSPLNGTLRGLITEGLYVKEGLKVADVDPRQDIDCWQISDKARAIGGAVLEAVLWQQRVKNVKCSGSAATA